MNLHLLIHFFADFPINLSQQIFIKAAESGNSCSGSKIRYESAHSSRTFGYAWQKG